MKRFKDFTDSLTEKKADKDYDKDGKIETPRAEYFGSKDKAIKKSMAMKKDCAEEKLADVITKDPIKESATIEEMLESALLDETSSRLKAKFVKFAKPKAMAQGFVGHTTGNKEEMDKADKKLKLIKKVQDKLDLAGIKEDEEIVEARFKKGEDIGKPNVGKDTGFANVAKKAAKFYGSKKSGERVAGAVLQKILAKKK